jgi:serine/threonine protein kinase
VILYSMLAGHRPFHGNSTATVIYKVVHQTPLALTALQPEISEELDKVVMRAIAKERSERFQNGAEMVAAIQRLRDNHDLDDESSRSLHSATLTNPSIDGPQNRPNFIKQQTERIRTMVGPAPAPVNNGASKWRNNVLKSAVGLALTLGAVGAIIWRGRHQSATTPATITNSVATADSTRMLQSGHDVAEASLRIEIEHHFESAQASFWLDGKLIYSHLLKGETKQRALLLRRTKGFISKDLRILSGRHEMRVRVKSSDDTFDQTQTVVGDCLTNKRNLLQVVAKRYELTVKLR